MLQLKELFTWSNLITPSQVLHLSYKKYHYHLLWLLITCLFPIKPSVTRSVNQACVSHPCRFEHSWAVIVWRGISIAPERSSIPKQTRDSTGAAKQRGSRGWDKGSYLSWIKADQNTCREVRGSRPVNTHRCLLSLLHGPNTITDNTVKATPPNTVSAGINSWRLVFSRLITRLLFISSSWNMLSKVRDNDLILMWLQRNVRQRNTLQRPHFLFSLKVKFYIFGSICVFVT